MTIKPNKRRFAIGFYLLTGWMPWGRELSEPLSSVGRCENGRWPICCGHVLRDAEVEAWKAAGLLVEAPTDIRGRRVEAGPQLERWLNDAFHNLRARSWCA